MNKIRVIGKKTLYNLDNKQTARNWAIEPVKKLKTFDAPNISSGVSVKDSLSNRGRIFNGAMGYLLSAANNIEKNTTSVALFTSAHSNGNGFGINQDNFDRCVSLFSARELVMPDWINSHDEYIAPDEANPKYKEYVNDSVIFSLFGAKSNQSSLRNMDYKGKKWDIKNEFFWLSKQEIADLAEKNNNKDCYDDAITSEDRYVYKYLQNITLSPEAQAVLDYANKLVHESFKYREDFNKNHPEYQINNWDCGYYQLKALWKEYMPEEFAEFRALYNKLAEKMRPMVYELGFLKK